MAFLSENLKELKEEELEFFQKDGGTFLSAYMYWTDNLFERIMRLFVWKGNGDILPKEIESRILIKGHCGIIKIQSLKLLSFTIFEKPWTKTFSSSSPPFPRSPAP